ncbi:MAG: nuclear transport factor 2 family protein, partial [Chloroflexota bacterium]|nr:nuclear transport factor 2 family protein [Chloroflexota bacterium]
MVGQAEVEIARKLFEEGWSGGHVDAPLQFMTEDVVMRDIVGHSEAMRGHDAVREFWAAAADTLKVLPEEIYVADSGVVVMWMAYGQIPADAKENAGRWGTAEGVSRLEFRDGKVCLEVDYWHGGQGVCDDWEAHWNARRARPWRGGGGRGRARRAPPPPTKRGGGGGRAAGGGRGPRGR